MGLYATFRCAGETEHIMKRMLEDKEYLESCIEKNLSFLKSIPNSVQYWQECKQDVFVMIRQLAKPTMFLTLINNVFNVNPGNQDVFVIIRQLAKPTMFLTLINNVFNVNPGNQGSPIIFMIFSTSSSHL
jgi:hypothetical protein